MPGDESRIYNRAEALARLDGDEALFVEMAGMFIAECDTYCAALSDAMAAQDTAQLRREAHTVKSLLATFSFESGRLVAQQLEHLAAGGSLEGAEMLTRDLVAATRQLASALSAEG